MGETLVDAALDEPEYVPVPGAPFEASELTKTERESLQKCALETFATALGYRGAFTVHVVVDVTTGQVVVRHWVEEHSSRAKATVAKPGSCFDGAVRALLAERPSWARRPFGFRTRGPFPSWTLVEEPVPPAR